MLPDVEMPMPSWVGVLQAAAAWGAPPWELTGEHPPRRLVWFLRRGVYENEMARAGRDRKTHGQ